MSYEGYNGTTGGFQTRTDDMRDAGSNFNKIASDYEGKRYKGENMDEIKNLFSSNSTKVEALDK